MNQSALHPVYNKSVYSYLSNPPYFAFDQKYRHFFSEKELNFLTLSLGLI
jgi:hypothetical protein